MLRETDPSQPSRKTSRTVRSAAGLLAATLLATGCTSQASGDKDAPVFPQLPVARGYKLPDSVTMSGPTSPTDEVASQLQLIRGLHNLAGKEYVPGADAEELAEQLRAASDPTTKAIVGRQVLKSIATYGFDAGQPVQKLSDVDRFLVGATAEEIARGRQLLTNNVYEKTLQEISYGKQEPEAIAGKIGDTEVEATSAFMHAAQLVDAADAFSSIYDENSAQKAAEDVVEATDPEIAALAKAYAEYEKVDALMRKYSYGGISRVDMEASLATVADGALTAIARTYMETVDNDTYKEQMAAERALRELEWQLNDRKRTLSDRAKEETEKVAVSSTTAVDELQTEQYDILDQFRAERTKAIEAFNASLEPAILAPLPELEDGFKPLDFSGVDSQKKIVVFGENEQKDKQYSQVAEAFVDSGTSRLRLEESAKLPSETQADLEKIYTDIAPLVEAAMQKGALFNVRFAVDTTSTIVTDYDFGAHYDPLEKAVYVVLPQNNSVSVDMLRQTIVHELTHALIHEAYVGVDVSEQEVSQMKAVCQVLSDEARSHFESSMRTSMDVLDRLISDPSLTPEEQAVFKQLRQYVEQGTVNANGRGYAEVFDDFVFGCESPSLYNLISKAITDAEEEAQAEEKDSTPGVTPQKVTYFELGKKLENNEDYKKLRIAWGEAVRMHSLYARFLNEAGRIQATSDVTMYIGHAEDEFQSGTEIPASLMSGLLGATEHMKLLYAGSSEEDKAIIRQSYDAVTGVLIARYPTLSAAIASAKDEVLGA